MTITQAIVVCVCVVPAAWLLWSARSRRPMTDHMDMRFHWKARRYTAQGLCNHADGMMTLHGDPFSEELLDKAYDGIAQVKGWQPGSFVIDSLSLIATRPEADQ